MFDILLYFVQQVCFGLMKSHILGKHQDAQCSDASVVPWTHHSVRSTFVIMSEMHFRKSWGSPGLLWTRGRLIMDIYGYLNPLKWILASNITPVEVNVYILQRHLSPERWYFFPVQLVDLFFVKHDFSNSLAFIPVEEAELTPRLFTPTLYISFLS